MPFRRWLLNVALALAVAAFLLPFHHRAGAQEPKGCAPIEFFAPVIERFATFRILEGEARLRAVILYNGEDEFIPWQSAYIAIRDDGWMFLMVGMDSTVCQYLRVPPDRVYDFMRQIEGVSV